MNAPINFDPVRDFQATIGGSPWDELTPEQQDNWGRLYRGEADWDGTPISSTVAGVVVDLGLQRRRRAAERDA